MEILKIFSDANDEERLYSVLLSEEELVLFSEVKDDPASSGLGKGAKVGLGVAGATAATGAGIYGAKKAGKVIVNRAQRVLDNAGSKIGSSFEKDLMKGEKMMKVGEKLQKPADVISKTVKKVLKRKITKK